MTKLALRPFIVRFDDWTIYQLEVMAEERGTGD